MDLDVVEVFAGVGASCQHLDGLVLCFDPAPIYRIMSALMTSSSFTRE